jgi:phosphatidylglycerophosphate synthase
MPKTGVWVADGLTASRLVLAAWFPLAPDHWRIGIVVAAAATDLVDGLISRACGATSVFGQILDPIADKTFMIVVLGTFLVEGRIPWWQALGLVARDLAVVAGSIGQVARRGLSSLANMPPSWLGKAATALQFLCALVLLLGRSLPALLFWPSAIVSVVAGVDYLMRPVRGGDPPAAA